MKLDFCLCSGNNGACLVGKHSTGVSGASLLAMLWAWVGTGRPVLLSWGWWRQWTKVMAVQVDGRPNPGDSQHQIVKIWARVQEVSG